MSLQIEPELFKNAGDRFNAFLTKNDNDKIVFSGKYGSGKTTFLRYFFENAKEIGLKEHNYTLFRISPVNYSVADLNADIIELIKYDIIIQFMLKGIDIVTADVPSSYFISEKDIGSIFRTLISLVNVKGIDLSRVLEGLEGFKERLDERKKNADEGDVFLKFLDRLESTSGIFERDIVTKTIENVLKRLHHEGKQPVLIIDDFDRLDPDHTFRILNIFSSHFDDEVFYNRGLKNKFGFEKVIIVCDYQNIQSLYHNRYGQDADFAGYIDKFYSSTIFEFDIKKEVKHFIRSILFKCDRAVIDQYGTSLQYFGSRSDEVLEQSIIYSVLHGSLALRTLLKLPTVNFHYHFLHIDRFFAPRTKAWHSLFILKVNLFLFGGASGYIATLERLVAHGFDLAIDIYTLELILAAEKRFKHYSDTDQIIIKTALHEYRFSPEQNGRTLVSSMMIDRQPQQIDRNITLDLMTHFLKRLMQVGVIE